MDSSKIFPVMLIYLLSVLARQFSLRTLPPTVQEVYWTGWFTWAFLYAGYWFLVCKRRSSSDLGNAKLHWDSGGWSRHLQGFGLSLAAVVTQYTRSQGIFVFVTPLVTLATLANSAETPANCDASDLLQLPQSESEHVPKNGRLLDKFFPGGKPWCIIVNLGLSLLIAGSISYDRVLLSLAAANSLIFLIAQIIVYALLPTMSRSNDSPLPTTGITIDLDLLGRISPFSLTHFTCLLIYSMSTPAMPDPMVLLRAGTDAAGWVALIILSSKPLATTAAILDTVAISFDLVGSSTEELKVLLALISSIGSIWQSINCIRLNRKFRNGLYLLMFIPLGSLSYNSYRRWTGSEKQDDNRMHPVESIILQAREDFSTLVNAQSKSLDQATREYAKRYGREPPPNFEKWFELAREHDFVLIDEFDTVMRSLEPFWGVAPSVLQTLITNVLAHFPNELVKCDIMANMVMTAQGNNAPWFRDSIARWLPIEWAGILPNMTLAINTFDEPSVCVPRDTLDNAMLLARSKGHKVQYALEVTEQNSLRTPRFLNIGKQDAWEAVTLSCPAHSSARSPICIPSPAEEPLSFIRNLTRSRDICEHCELQDLEGFFLTPETLRLTHSLVPIWSQAKGSSFNDIVYPSPYYQARSGDYIEIEDPEWSSKDNQLYWVGAATGGHATESNWKQMQRQRMTLMTQVGSNAQIKLLKKSESGRWVPYTTNMSAVSGLFSTRVVGVSSQCDQAACEAEKEAFGIGDEEVKDPNSAAYAHKLVLDLDGNGFSGRFYRLLRSKSMVIKQTAFEEWHDDRLIPWIHYIPVSSSFEELPELVRFLATTETGEVLATRIAQESRDWTAKILRDVDLQLVWLRMLLEYGRIYDVNGDR